MAANDKEFVQQLGSFSNARITELKKLKKVPMYTWAALLIGLSSRDDYLTVFRNIIDKIKIRHNTKSESIYPNHWSLRNLTNEQFDDVFESLLASPIFKENVATLAEMSGLPDIGHWKRHINEDQKANNFS